MPPNNPAAYLRPTAPQPSVPQGAPAPGQQPMPQMQRPAPAMQQSAPAMQAPGAPMQQGPQFGPFRQHLMQGIASLTPQERQALHRALLLPGVPEAVEKLVGPELSDVIQRSVANARANGGGMPAAAPMPASRPMPQTPGGQAFNRITAG